jgi:hypothetical protein
MRCAPLSVYLHQCTVRSLVDYEVVARVDLQVGSPPDRYALQIDVDSVDHTNGKRSRLRQPELVGRGMSWNEGEDLWSESRCTVATKALRDADGFVKSATVLAVSLSGLMHRWGHRRLA